AGAVALDVQRLVTSAEEEDHRGQTVLLACSCSFLHRYKASATGEDIGVVLKHLTFRLTRVPGRYRHNTTTIALCKYIFYHGWHGLTRIQNPLAPGIRSRRVAKCAEREFC